MNFLQIWLGSPIPDLAHRSRESIKSIMLNTDSYRMVTNIKECHQFMTPWFANAIPNYEDQGYKKWAFRSAMLRINHAALDGELCYADTDTIFHKRPEPTEGKVPLTYGDGHLSVFYVNGQAGWFKALLIEIEKDIPMSPAWSIGMEHLSKAAELPEDICTHYFLRGEYDNLHNI